MVFNGLGAIQCSRALAATDLIAAYAFDEGSGVVAADSSGNNNAGRLMNGPSWTFGRFGTGLSFDGINEFVDAGNIAALNGLREMTVSAWIKGSVGAFSPDGVIVAKDQAFALVVGLDALLKAQFGIKSGDTWYGFPASLTDVDDGNFHYVTGVYDGVVLKIYVDGVLESSQSIGAVVLNEPLAALQIGSCLGGPDCGGSGEMWSGVIDEVRIYNRALSQIEIQTDMNTPL